MKYAAAPALAVAVLGAAALGLANPACAPAQAGDSAGLIAPLVAAYPDHLARAEGNVLVWRDGTRMEIDDGQGVKGFEQWLAAPDIDDMLAIPYSAGDTRPRPAENADPGRARNLAFFDKMYGDCRKGEVAGRLAEVIWLPRKASQRLRVTTVNGVDRKLAAVSAELDALSGAFDIFLFPAAGTYNCRSIAGTDRPSAHGYGIAIDIALRRADYWRWSGSDARAGPKHTMPIEIVRIFERHGFIWGGRWFHFDTMHFEYRPELLKGAVGGGGR